MNYKNLCRTKSQKGNLEAVSSILNILREYSESNPDLRFHQILWNLGIFEWKYRDRIKDKHYETSQETFKRIVGIELKKFKGRKK